MRERTVPSQDPLVFVGVDRNTDQRSLNAVTPLSTRSIWLGPILISARPGGVASSKLKAIAFGDEHLYGWLCDTRSLLYGVPMILIAPFGQSPRGRRGDCPQR